MATRADMADERAVSIGNILSRAFGVLGDNPVATFGIAFLIGALPQQVAGYFYRPLLLNSDPNNPLPTIALSLGSMVIFMLFYALVQGALVRATIAYANGTRASIGECLGIGLTMAVPLIGLSILLILGMMVGLLLLIVPGVILYTMWSVAVPALVAEESGVFAAFGRSRFLTKGARWKVFGLNLLMLVLAWLLSALLGLAMIMSGSAQSLAEMSVGYLLISTISSTLVVALFSTVQASLYISLLRWKEGPQAEALAEVFA
jgi:hypothetical protein